MSWQPTRDLIGYGENPPDPKWPNGARLAVNFVMNYEEGSEPSVQDGEGYTETGLTESTSSAGRHEGPRPRRRRHVRVRQPRRLLASDALVPGARPADDGVRLRAGARAQSAGRRGDQAAGFDVCCHGWRWVKHFMLSEAEEREHIAKAMTSLQQTVGQRRPAGIAAMDRASTRAACWSSMAASSTTATTTATSCRSGRRSRASRTSIVPYSLTNNDGKYADTMAMPTSGSAW